MIELLPFVYFNLASAQIIYQISLNLNLIIFLQICRLNFFFIINKSIMKSLLTEKKYLV